MEKYGKGKRGKRKNGKALSDAELLSLVKSRKYSSMGTDADGGNDLSNRRERNLKQYLGKPYGDEITGQSRIVTRQCLEAIEWALPSLMRVFASSEKIVEFKATSLEDEPLAKQESGYINHLYNNANGGFVNTYTFIKSVLMNPTGYMKIYWAEEEEVTTETFEGLLPRDIEAKLQDTELEAIESDSYMTKVNLGGFETEVECFTVKFQRTRTTGKLMVEPVPPEEMYISGQWNKVTLDGCDYICHTTYPTRSDLINRGYDKEIVKQLPSSDGIKKQKDETRDRHDNAVGSDGEYDTSTDQSTEVVEFDEHYLFVDYDGDGIAEYRMVSTCGGKVFENDEIAEHPFIAGCAVPLPHTHVGLAWQELVEDLQRVYTTLMRQYLNNLYRVNNPRPITGRGVNLQDVINDLPGSPIRCKDINQLRHEQTPGVGQHVLPAFQVLKEMKETRTGVSKSSMGLDADTLSRVGNGAFYASLDQANQRLELLARIIAEFSFKPMFLKIHRTVKTHQEDVKEVKLSGEWVTPKPTAWPDRKDMKGVVGLGTGNKQAQAMGLEKIIAPH